ncbi:MAG: tetratricopeptide repeat protein [Bryobacteraceae bacterium]
MTRWLALAALLLAACATKKPPPDLPAVDVSGMQAAVRDVIDGALTAARAKPDDAALAARLGMALHAHNQLAGAARAYERAAALDPANAGYAYYWGVALAADGRYSDAVIPLRAALSIPPARLRLADALYAAGKTVEARKEYEAVRDADPGNAAAYYGLGRCLQGPEAIAAFQKAVQLFPRYGAARFSLAAVYRQQGQRAQADATLENYERDKLLSPPIDDPAMAAVQALDVSATGLLRASQSLERQGQLPQAAELQERVLAADPKLTQAWVNLISLYARLGRPENAEAAYRNAIALEPKNAEAHYNFGVLCAQTERFKEARMAFQSAVAIDPAHAEALDNLGALIETTGAWDSAAALYRRALAAKPGLRLAHYHLGRILANRRRWPEAIGEFEKSIEPSDEQTPGFLYALGATHARAGSRARAIEILQRAKSEATRWGQGPLAAAIERDLGVLHNRN